MPFPLCAICSRVWGLQLLVAVYFFIFPDAQGLCACPLMQIHPVLSVCLCLRSPGYKVCCITPHQCPSQWDPKGRASLSHLTPAWSPAQRQGTQVPKSPSPAALADLGHCHPLPSPTEHCGPERRLHRKPTDVLLAVGGPAPASPTTLVPGLGALGLGVAEAAWGAWAAGRPGLPLVLSCRRRTLTFLLRCNLLIQGAWPQG